MDVLPCTVESSFCDYLYHATLYFMKWILHLFAFLFLLVGILKQMAVCFSAEDNKIDAGTYFHSKWYLLADLSCFSAQNSLRICNSYGFSVRKNWKSRGWWWFFVDFSGQKKKINVKCFKDVKRKMLKSSQIEIHALERNSDQKSSWS